MHFGYTLPRDHEFCGALNISKRIVEDSYWTLSEYDPYYQSCKFINARYNCSRFTTSAAKYKVEYSLNANLNCKVPDFEDLISILTTNAKPKFVFFLGDSHVMQIFQSILCTFQKYIEDIEAFTTMNDYVDLNTKFEKVVFKKHENATGCHEIRYRDYNNFFLNDYLDNKKSGLCQLSHIPGQISCFKLPIVSMKHKFSLFCSSYVRPLTGYAAVVSGLDIGLSSMNMSINNFDSIVTNAYISPKDLGQFLNDIGYQSKLFVLPKFHFAKQTGFQFFSTVIKHPKPKEYEVQNLRDEIISFCSDFYKTYTRIPNICRLIDYTYLSEQRSFDAKASIFPMVYQDGSNRSVVCQNYSNTINNCIGKDFRVCSSSLLPCHDESHFCLPGPTDEFGLLVVASIISDNDYVHTLH